MKTFMLGWEFPPLISGGLGTACYGLTKAMGKLGTDIIFVLPKAGKSQYSEHLTVFDTESDLLTQLPELKNVKFFSIHSHLRPYINPQTFRAAGQSSHSSMRFESLFSAAPGFSDHYGGDLYHQVMHYADRAGKIASTQQFDIIHAHDWMTFPAGAKIAKMAGKPFVAHVHSTEFDRSGDNVNQGVYEIERAGMHAADRIIAVSNFTRQKVINQYGISQEKIDVVYNGIDLSEPVPQHICDGEKIEKVVLFLGRVTMQKGPDYFVNVAKRVLDKRDNVKFIIAGKGDMTQRIINRSAELGIGHKVLFAGFVGGELVHRAYQMADLFVMPSVSEPFGIVPLEALRHRVPVIISKQSGISEILTNALKVDFWDIDEMANQIISVLKYPALHYCLSEYGRDEATRFTWDSAAACVHKVYEKMLVSA
jgi:glycogen(starch) synthase